MSRTVGIDLGDALLAVALGAGRQRDRDAAPEPVEPIGQSSPYLSSGSRSTWDERLLPKSAMEQEISNDVFATIAKYS